MLSNFDKEVILGILISKHEDVDVFNLEYIHSKIEELMNDKEFPDYVNALKKLWNEKDNEPISYSFEYFNLHLNLLKCCLGCLSLSIIDEDNLLEYSDDVHKWIIQRDKHL